MARNRTSIQKPCNFEDTRRQTRREKLHQLCLDAANASISNHNWMMDPPLTVASDWHPTRNQFEPLAHLENRKSRWFANRHSRRRRAREHKRKGLIEFQLATLNADLSTRFDHVIRTNEHNSNVRLPDLDLSPMQMIKWQPPAYSPVVTPAPLLQHISDTDWSSLEIKFSPPVKRVSAAPCPSPPTSLMTAAELGLLTPLTPKVCLPELNNGLQDAVTVSVDASIVKSWMSSPPAATSISQDSYLCSSTPEDGNVASSFVAAKLPHFRDIDPFDLTMPSTPDVNLSKYDYSKSPPQATRCTLYHEKDDHDTEGTSLDFSQSLRSCEEGRMPGLIHNESTNPQAFALDIKWPDEPAVDWPYDVVGDWNDEPFLDWNGEPVADWVDESIDDCFDDLVMIEHDAETFDWTFLSRYRALSNCASTLSSASSSMEVLPLPLRDSLMEERSAYEEPIREPAGSAHEEPVRELAEEGLNMRRVSKSAWESETDFCIPAFF
ncbi:hypothetical protein KCU93_g1182, partial [Aureobasidium melanogenum]